MEFTLTFRIVFFSLLVAMLIIRVIFSMRLKRSGESFMPDQQAIRHEGVGLFISRVILFFVLIAILLLYAIHHPWMEALDFYLPTWLRWLGFAIGVASIALLIWVQIELGRQFSPQLQLRQEHQLITIGPYTRVRHPLYTAMFGFGLSLALVSANLVFRWFLCPEPGWPGYTCTQRRADDAGPIRGRVQAVHAANRAFHSQILVNWKSLPSNEVNRIAVYLVRGTRGTLIYCVKIYHWTLKYSIPRAPCFPFPWLSSWVGMPGQLPAPAADRQGRGNVIRQPVRG